MGSTLSKLKEERVLKQLREKNKNQDGERDRRGHRGDLRYGVEALGKDQFSLSLPGCPSLYRPSSRVPLILQTKLTSQYNEIDQHQSPF